MVKVKISVDVPARKKVLERLRGIKGMDCDVESTWKDFFEQAVQVKLNPEQYYVTSSSNSKNPVRLDQKVRDLIGQYKKILTVYKVSVKEKGPNSKLPPPPNVRLETTAKKSKGRPPNHSERSGQFKRETSPPVRPTSPTSTVPMGGGRASPRKGTKRPGPAPPHNPQPHQRPRQEYPEDQHEAGFPNGGPYQFQYMDDDDNASQVTTDSQESQDDLGDLANEDFKPKAVQRFMRNITNVQSIRIREELKKTMMTGKWNRISSKIPHTANYLMEIFRFQPQN